MAVVIIATPGAANANSYETLVEANEYFAARVPLVPPWDEGESNAAALVMGTRVIDSLSVPHRRLVKNSQGLWYYITSRSWTGAPASDTQALAWPRTGMRDRLGRAIPSNVIPRELKDALSEFAGQLAKSDLTLDSDVSVQGISSVSAGSVSVSFKDDVESKVLPDAVWNLMPPSWFTDELVEPASRAEFDVI